MPQPYLRPLYEINFLRQNQGGFRDDNWNLGWTRVTGTGSFTTDGDIGTMVNGVTGVNEQWGKTVAGSVSTTTYTNVSARYAADSAITPSINVLYTDSTFDAFTLTAGTGQGKYSVANFTLTVGKTISSIRIATNSTTNSVTVQWDWIAVCQTTTLVSQKQDVDPIQAMRATTSADDLTFNLRNTSGYYTTGSRVLNLYDTIYVYLGYIQDDLITRKLSKVFGGTIEELTPNISKSQDILTVHGFGWGQQLQRVYSTKEYGSQSINSSINTMTGAITDIIGVVNAGGYQLTTTYVQSFTNNALTYVVFKTEPAFNAIKQLCDLLTTNNDASGTTTQPVEFWVDPAENCHLAPLGAWGSDPNPSTYPNALNVGRDQISNTLRQDIEGLINQVHFWSINVEPPDGDYWTETVAANTWAFTSGATGGTSSGPSYDTTNKQVGTQSITASWTGASTGSLQADLKYPSAANLTLDVTKLGGRIQPPILKFYAKCNQTVYAPQVILWTNAGTNGYLGEPLPIGVAGTQNGINNSDWHLWTYAIGPLGDKFTPTGTPSWSNINQIDIAFQFVAAKTSGQVWIDGLRIDGQTHYVAKNSTKITSYGLRESHFVNNKHRKREELQLLAKAELFRSMKPVRRGTISVPGIQDILPGQKVTVTAPSANLTSATLRVLEVRHRMGTGDGFVTDLDVTDDLTNYQALAPVSLSNMLLDLPQQKTGKRRSEYDIGLEKPDPTNVTTTVDYPS